MTNNDSKNSENKLCTLYHKLNKQVNQVKQHYSNLMNKIKTWRNTLNNKSSHYYRYNWRPNNKRFKKNFNGNNRKTTPIATYKNYPEPAQGQSKLTPAPPKRAENVLIVNKLAIQVFIALTKLDLAIYL